MVYDAGGKQVAGASLRFGQGSNNEAEAWACEALLERL